MLHIRKVLGAKPKEHVKADLRPLLTPWGERLDVDHVLNEHPQPQFARASYQVLNGRWDCAFVGSAHEPTADLGTVVRAAAMPAADAFDHEIIVPFSPEALLSGVGRQLQPDELLWYRRAFTAPELNGDERLLLHFQAVDYACSVRVNGHAAGQHVGGYTPFVLDITALICDGENELAVCVADPSERGGRLRGKQRLDRGDIWYTAQSGIWQTVWLETVPAAHIVSVEIEPDAETGILAVGARLAGMGTGCASQHFRVEALGADDAVVASAECAAEATCAVAMCIPDVHRWSPNDPSYILSATSRAVAAPFSFRREYGIKGVHGAEGAWRWLLECGSSRKAGASGPQVDAN